MLFEGLVTAKEAILNHFLQLDPEFPYALNTLAGKVLELKINNLSYYWIFTHDKIIVKKYYTGVVDLVLQGTLFNFVHLSLMKKEMALNAFPIQISGDMEFAKKFKDLFANLEIDWEEQLSKIVSDNFSFPIVQFFKSLFLWAKQSTDDLSQNVTDYLQAELDFLVTEEELQIFFSNVDDLRDDLARLEKRTECVEIFLKSVIGIDE